MLSCGTVTRNKYAKIYISKREIGQSIILFCEEMEGDKLCNEA